MSKSKKQSYLEMSDSELNRSVLVQGTSYDRRRKLSNQFIYNLKRRFNNGTDVAVIARDAGISIRDVRYHVDENYKHAYNKLRKLYKQSDSSSNPGELANYKRELLKQGKHLIYK